MSTCVQQLKDLMIQARNDFENGVDTNGEREVVEFFISELTNTMHEDVILLRPSQCYGVCKLLTEKVPNMKFVREFTCQPFFLDGRMIDEGQISLHVSWEGPFPGTTDTPACFS